MYLSVAVVFGPTLCCCALDSLFPSTAQSACGHEGGCKPHTDDGHGGHAHHAKAGHHHHGHNGHHAEAKPPASEEEPAPCDHEPGKCPCGEHQQTMAATQPSDAVGQRSLELHDDVFSTFAVFILPLASLEQEGASMLRLGEIRPSGINGREILRAYHKLQC